MQSRKISTVGISLFVGIALIAAGVVGVVKNSQSDKPVLGQMVNHDVSAPLIGLVAKPTVPYELESEESFSEENAPEREGAGAADEESRNATLPKIKGAQAKSDLLSQSNNQGVGTAAVRQMPATATSWNGVGANGYAPPDTSMDVSPSQVLQISNVKMQAWDKAGNTILSARATNSVFVGFGGLCETTNDGDATAVYDRLNNRWVISQFAVTGANGSTKPYLQCVAVSTSSDLLGNWNRYSFAYSVFPDYPKLAVWPGTYYTTFNGFAGGTRFSGAIVCGYNMAAMLAGLPATQACKTLTADYSILVAGVEGSIAPPAGTPAYAASLSTTSSLNSYRVSTNWSGAGVITMTGPTSIAVSPYAQACGGGACISQSGTTNVLDSLADRLMYRYVYRNLNGKTSLLVSHSVTSNSLSAVRWYEFQDTAATATSTPTVFQQGTFDGGTTHRWMPSISSDKNGDIALVYSSSSSTTFPSIATTGRLVTDPAGTMSQAESIVFAGLGSQTGTLQRWGDYAATVVDPGNDCSFWVSSEYQPANGSFNWATRILSFNYPTCSAAPLAAAPSTPAAPTAIAATGQATISWAAPANGGSAIDYYTVTQSTTAGGTYTAASASCTQVNALTCVATGLTGGTTYYFKVVAHNPYGSSAVSTASTGATPAALTPQATLTLVPAVTSGPSGTAINLSITGGSGTGAFAFATSTAGCTAATTNATTGTGTIIRSTTSGTCSVTATRAASGIYSAITSAPVTVTFTAPAQAALIITNSNTTNIAKGNTGIRLTTSGGSGTGAVTFAVTGTGCTLSGTRLTVATNYLRGTLVSCSVVATKAASGIYGSISSAPKVFNFL